MRCCVLFVVAVHGFLLVVWCLCVVAGVRCLVLCLLFLFVVVRDCGCRC